LFVIQIIKVVLRKVTALDLEVEQMNVKTFFYGDLKEEIYMKHPDVKNIMYVGGEKTYMILSKFKQSKEFWIYL